MAFGLWFILFVNSESLRYSFVVDELCGTMTLLINPSFFGFRCGFPKRSTMNNSSNVMCLVLW